MAHAPARGLPEAAARLAARFRPDGFTLLLAAVAVLGAAFVLLRQVNYGVGVSGDSIAYISTARNLLAGNGFTVWSTSPYQNYPPLYPAALAATGVFGADPADTAGWLNAAVFGLIVFVSSMWLRRHARSAFPVAWAAAALALSYPLALVSSRAIADPLFALFTALTLCSLDRFLRTGRRADLAWPAIFTALACLDRYIGVAIAAGVVILLFLRFGASVRERTTGAALYSIVSLAPLGLWMLRNLLLTGAPARRVPAVDVSLPFNLKTGFAAVAEWLAGRDDFRQTAWFDRLAGTEADVWVTAVAGAALLAASYAVLRSVRSGAARARAGSLPHRPGPAAACAVVTIVYVVLAAAGLSILGIGEELYHRYLAPVYAPALCMAALGLDALLRHDARRKPLGVARVGGRALGGGRGALTLALAAGACCWLLLQANLYAAAFRAHLDHGYGGNSRSWAASDTVRSLGSLSPPGQIWTNDPDDLHFRTGIRVYVLPLSEPLDDAIRLVFAEAAGDHVYVVWFHHAAHARDRYGAPELRLHPNLSVVADRADGVVLRASEDAADRLASVRRRYEAVVSGDPLIRSAFDVYLDADANAIAYVREPCAGADVAWPFILHVVPASAGDLPADRRRSGFENLDFAFAERGVRFGGKCLAEAPLPAYRIARLRVGQWDSAGQRDIWKEEILLGE